MKETTTKHSSQKRPRGGALVFVLVLLGAAGVCCLLFVSYISEMQASSRQSIFQASVDSGLRSAVDHAAFLLRQDLSLGPSDGPRDVWVTLPRGTVVKNGRKWARYATALTNLTEQRWFEFPGPVPGTTVRYRFKLVDVQPSARRPAGAQPFVPAAWRDGEWLPTDDINAVDAAGLQALIGRFDARATNADWSARALALLVDDRDENHALSNEEIEDTEAIRFDRFVTDVDVRWNHLDDTLRLGRYYEERPNHNFFLVKDAKFWYNEELGRTNVAVTLEREPMAFVPGWAMYRDLRDESGLPRWYEGMWEGVIAATGSGRPEPYGLFKYQPVVSNSEDTLYFDDDNLARFQDDGDFRQAVTFKGWFSSLNEYLRARVPAAKERGALVTTKTGVPDCIVLTNLGHDTQYRVTLFTGQRLPTRLTATVGFFGLEELSGARFDTNGAAVLRGGRPLKVRPLFGGSCMEMIIRSPRVGVDGNNPFYLESALLEQPEFIVLRNVSDKPINVRGWQLGFRCGARVFWTRPFRSAAYHRRLTGRVTGDFSPTIPARGRLIITPDAELLDWFVGTNPNGRWGDISGERIPVVEVGWESWSPTFTVKARPGREYRMIGPSNTSDPNDPTKRGYVWETDWRMNARGAEWSPSFSDAIGEVVMFDPDGGGDDAPVVGVVVGQSKRLLTVRLAGSRKRFNVTPEATLRFHGIPDAAREFWLVTPEGDVASHALQPARTRGRREPREQFSLSRHEERHFDVTCQRLTPIVNRPFGGPESISQRLAGHDIARDNDWFMSDSLYRSFVDAVSIRSKTLRWSRAGARIARHEKGWLIWDAPGPELPEGTPGALFATAHAPDLKPLSVRAVRPTSFSIHATPGIVMTQLVGRVVELSPCSRGGGVHLFGAPGSLACEWNGFSRPDWPVKVTIAGRAVRHRRTPATVDQWMRNTNNPVNLSVEIWNPKTLKYDMFVAKKSFDCADRLYVGELSPGYFARGVLRMRITTHDALAPGRAAIWLNGIYIHPFSAKKYVNVNTLTPHALLAACGNDAATAAAISATRSRRDFASVCEIPSAMKKAHNSKRRPTHLLAVRSDVFDLCVEAQVIRQGGNKAEILAQRKRSLRLDRSNARMDINLRVKRVLDCSHVDLVQSR